MSISAITNLSTISQYIYGFLTADSEIRALVEAFLFFAEDLTVIENAKLYSESHFFLDIKTNDFLIKAKARSSTRDKAYSVTSIWLTLVALHRQNGNAVVSSGFAGYNWSP